MHPDLNPTLDALRQEGPRRFAHWDADLFEALVRGPAAKLATEVADAPDRTAILQAYLRLLQEGVGTGCVRQAGRGPLGWTTFLECCLVEVIPGSLTAVSAPKRLEFLVKVWNLGEGLRREPEWVDRYVSACAPSWERGEPAEDFLARTLEPVLTPPRAAKWQGPFRVQVLDLRPLHDEFLPGLMRLAAPSVLCVADRRLAGVQIGVLLRPGGKSQALGVLPGLGRYAENLPTPKIATGDRELTVSGQTVALPALRRAQGQLVSGAGFVALSAKDSQRLWIVETP
jgi:hypothetical protein